MFQLTAEESKYLKFQIGTSKSNCDKCVVHLFLIYIVQIVYILFEQSWES